MKFFFILLLLSVFTLTCLSQSNSIQTDLLGNALLTSVNFEHQMISKKLGLTFYRLGLGIAEDRDKVRMTIPTELGIILGKRNNHLEFSTGFTYTTYVDHIYKYSNSYDTLLSVDERKAIVVYWFSRIGYRYQKPDGGFIYRIGFTPLNARFSNDKRYNQYIPFPWAGMSFGYVFGKKKK